MELADAVAHWTEHGYVMLPGYIPAADLVAAQADLRAMFPTAEEFHSGADPVRNARFREDEFAGIVPFPFPGAPDLGLLAVHPLVVGLASAILGTDDVRLYSCEAWAKYAGAAPYEQDHHADWPGHTPLVPSGDPRFREVEIFVYPFDVPEGCAPTRYVPKSVTRDLPVQVRPSRWTREEQPALYDAEVSSAGPAGTVVAYSVDTYHRAVDFTDPRGARFTVMPNYRAGASEWMTRYSWGKRAYYDEWYDFVARASYEQLLLFGFPPAGHPFWTPETLAAMAVRYPTLDLAPWAADV